MPRLKPGAESLAKLERELEVARIKLVKYKRLTGEQLRRKQTRQKIVLAGALIAQARTDDALKALVERLTREVPRPQDRAMFEDVTVEDLLAIPDDVDGGDVRNSRSVKKDKAVIDAG